jgi:hypothetical protein
VSDQSSEPNRDQPGTPAEPGTPVGVIEPADDRDSDVGLGDAEQIAAELAAVDRALARIEAGDHGNCTECGTRLDDALLAADPTASICPAHLGLEHVAPEPAGETSDAEGESPVDAESSTDTEPVDDSEPPVEPTHGDDARPR